MKRQTFAVLFYIKKARIGKLGETPILARITLNGVRAEFQLKRKVKPEQWDSAKERVNGKGSIVEEINNYLTGVRATIFNIHQEIEMSGREITADLLKRRFLGMGTSQKTLLELFDEHNKKMNALVGKEFSQKTADRYETTYKHLSEFMQRQLHRKDVAISEVNYQFITDFDVFLQTTKGCIHNSAIKHLKALKKVVRIALVNEWIKRNPFENYKLREDPVEKDFLTKEELERIIKKKMTIQRLDVVRDIFVFCCYTSLSYIDVKLLTPEHLSKDNRGQLWIRKSRQKTRNMCLIPLLPPALEIIEKYKEHPVCQTENVVLPVPSNQRLNSYLQEIADICRIRKKITMHVARHTFATTVALANGVSLETLSKVMGHNNIRSTQIYARITDTKISNEM